MLTILLKIGFLKFKLPCKKTMGCKVPHPAVNFAYSLPSPPEDLEYFMHSLTAQHAAYLPGCRPQADTDLKPALKCLDKVYACSLARALARRV